MIRNRGKRTLGVAQYRIATSTITRTASNGHLAMSHTFCTSLPTPRASPIAWVTGPETIRITRAAAHSTTVTTVTTSCIGRIRQNGRPSSTS